MKANDGLETPSVKILLWDHTATFYGMGKGQRIMLVYWFDLGNSVNKNKFIYILRFLLSDSKMPNPGRFALVMILGNNLGFFLERQVSYGTPENGVY